MEKKDSFAKISIGYYILKYKNSNHDFVAIDSASGGYPYKVKFEDARKFHSLEHAQKYSKGEFDIVLVEQRNNLSIIV